MKMPRKYFKTLALWVLGVGSSALLIIEVLILVVQIGPTPSLVASVTQLTPAPIAIVLGASVLSPTRPSDALYDRLVRGAELYQSGVVSQVLLTGDGGAFRSDEISVMSLTLQKLGVPLSAIMVDREGFRTYESCKRAVQVFSIHNAIIVTQRFHLARSLFLCEHFGMRVQGIPADRQPYVKIFVFSVRELLASVKATMDVFIYPPSSPVQIKEQPLLR